MDFPELAEKRDAGETVLPSPSFSYINILLEREREIIYCVRERERDHILCERVGEIERERERQRQRQKDRDRKTETEKLRKETLGRLFFRPLTSLTSIFS